VIADAGSDTTFCEGIGGWLDGSNSINATTFDWTLVGVSQGTNDSLFVNGLPAGTYQFVLEAINGPCSDFDTVTVVISPTPVADAGPDIEAIEGTTVSIGGSPTGPAGSTFTWNPAVFLSDTTLANPDLEVTEPGTYTVTVVSTDGCIGIDSMTVLPLPDIEFPNGITPNGDGKNDVWIIDEISQFPDAVVEVYNRWGQMLFRSVGYVDQWDGTYNNEPLPVGTYYYVIELNHVLYPDAITGPITILR
jgi:gliding motility-associated-like protein